MTNERSGASMVNVLIGVVLVAAVVVGIVAVTQMDPRGTDQPRTGREYEKEARAAGQIDQARIAWTEAATWDVPMEAPVAIARGANGYVVVGERVVVLNGDGTVRMRSEVVEPSYRAVAVDGADRVYAATAKRIDLLAIDGDTVAKVRSASVPDLKTTFGAVTVTGEGVYLGDTAGCRVFQVPPGLVGEDSVTPAFELVAENLMVPSSLDLAVTPEDELVTVDPGRHLVQFRDVYGDVVRSFGKLGPGVEDFHGCCNPIAIAFLPDERIVTAEKGVGATRVKVYDRSGNLESIVAAPAQFDEVKNEKAVVLDVACAAEGERILVLDPHRRQVRVFTPKEEQ